MRSVFYGTKGTIICDNTSPTIQLFESCGEKNAAGTQPDYTEAKVLPVEVNNHNITAEIAAFIDGITGKKNILVTSREGASSVAVCCATVESAAKGGETVKIRYPEV